MNFLHNWLIYDSLPLWAAHGVDRKNGGFYEKLSKNLLPSNDPRRARLVARQIYFFAVGAALGWQGPYDQLLLDGFSYLLNHFVSTDGRVKATCSADGQPIDSRQHLYDVAFVLLALAKLSCLSDRFLGAEDIARSIAYRLSKNCTNSIGGYLDIVTPDMQCSNPHMHLFEAFITWAELRKTDFNFWLQRANHCAELALTRMILPESGLLPEYFDLSWSPVPVSGSLVIEPGHQFEWSWLLTRWSSLVHSSEGFLVAKRLCFSAEKYGVDHKRNAVFERIDQNLIPLDNTARLWQQTERLKAWHCQSLLSGSVTKELKLSKAFAGIHQFIAGPRPGLWFDTMDSTGNFLDEYVKASSGYHLACAIEAISSPLPLKL
jgi:mannose/cellobiose epimerase-like protein (N-acyl-D-glucosamine 2-epimerase family)